MKFDNSHPGVLFCRTMQTVLRRDAGVNAVALNAVSHRLQNKNCGQGFSKGRWAAKSQLDKTWQNVKLTFCQPGSWLLICHWRNLGHDFYFLLGVWSVCVCSKRFRPEGFIKATASSRVEAVCDSIQGSQENPLAPHSSKLCCTALGARVVASCPKWHVVGRWQ